MVEKNGYVKSISTELGNKKLDLMIVKQLLDEWIVDSPYSSTYRGKVSALKKIWYEQNGYNKRSFSDIEWVVAEHIKPSLYKRKPVYYIDENDYRKILASCRSKRQECFIEFLATTGIRVSEMCNIKYSDIRNCNNGIYIKIVSGKTNIPIDRIIPFTLSKKINDTFGGSVFLFETATGRPYGREYIGSQIAKIGELAINQAISPHSFRHYWVLIQSKSGESPFLTAKKLGHINPGSHIDNYRHEYVS